VGRERGKVEGIISVRARVSAEFSDGCLVDIDRETCSRMVLIY